MERNNDPGWFNIEGASAWSGLSTRTIEDLIAEKLVKSRNVKKPGKTRGRRLVSCESLNSYIESCGEDMSELVMNVGRSTGGLTMSHTYSDTKPAPVNATEMGKLVGLSRQKIVALHEDGAIPAEVAEGRTYRFDPDKVRAALAARAASRAGK